MRVTTSQLASEKILMFAKVSLARFIYGVIHIFCFLKDVLKDAPSPYSRMREVYI